MSSSEMSLIRADRTGFTCVSPSGNIRQPIELEKRLTGEVTGRCPRAEKNNGLCGPNGPQCPLPELVANGGQKLGGTIFIPLETAHARGGRRPGWARALNL